MSANWNLVIHNDAILPKKFDREVLQFLSLPKNQQILYWLDDSHCLLKVKQAACSVGNHHENYYDYSFMITPAFKALELWIINIAPVLGVEPALIEKAREKGQFNAFLNDDPIQELADAVIAKLNDRAKNEKPLRVALNSLGSYLSTLRHTPAHCGHTIENPEKAETHFSDIISGINRTTGLLIEAKVIEFKTPEGKPRTDTIWS